MNLADKLKSIVKLLRIYKFDFDNDIRYTSYFSGIYRDKETLLSSLAVDAHTIEKGLTMPEKRFNFGHAKIKSIAMGVFYCAEHFGSDGDRFEDIVGILKEYYRWHKESSVAISDEGVKMTLDTLEEKFPDIKPVLQIYDETKEHYFSLSKADFKEFALSRHSCRNLSGKVNDEDLRKALDIALSTVPSTCNRQSVRVHVLTSKKVLEIQHGNRGFGHLADKYLLLTSTLTHWPSNHQRNAPYVDGGIFLMNLLYSLHYYKIGAVTLNMFLDKGRTEELHKNYDIPSDEVPIVLIAIGTPPEKFDLTRSSRRTFDSIVTYHN